MHSEAKQRSVSTSGLFSRRVRGDTPLVAAAIHHGHELRPEVAERLALDASGRLHAVARAARVRDECWLIDYAQAGRRDACIARLDACRALAAVLPRAPFGATGALRTVLVDPVAPHIEFDPA